MHCRTDASPATIPPINTGETKTEYERRLRAAGYSRNQAKRIVWSATRPTPTLGAVLRGLIGVGH